MNKENVITIGYYHIPGSMYYNMFLEDTKSYEKDSFEVLPEEVNTFIEKYKEMYPKHQVCQFVY